MSTYLSRPIFPLPIDWSTTPARTFTYNLRELQIGFGPQSVAPLQQEIVHGLSFSLNLQPADVAALDAFLTALQHGAQGFWLPSENEVFTMAGDLVDGVCLIAAQNLAATFRSLPALYVWFQPDEGAAFAAQVASVVTVDANTERVTLTNTSLACAACMVNRLLYVRMAGDVEEAAFEAEGYSTRSLRVVELPLEYALAETGQRPIFLFDFSFNFPAAQPLWRYTSFMDPVTMDGISFAAKPITYKSLKRATTLEQTTCTIETILDPAGPFELYASGASELPLQVTISKTTLPDLPAPTVIFAGEIVTPSLTGRTIEATVSNFVTAFSRRLPRPAVQPRCNWALFAGGSCGLKKYNWQIIATIAALPASGKGVITLTGGGIGAAMTGFYAQGVLQLGIGDSAQIRIITYDSSADANTRNIMVDRPVNAAAGNVVTLLPGCDRSVTTCQTKFNNYANFGGHPFVPARNLSMNITTTATTGGNKK